MTSLVTDKFYTELTHEMIRNTIDDIPVITTREIQLPTANNALISYLLLPYLTPKKKYKKRDNEEVTSYAKQGCCRISYFGFRSK